jgi:uncharacterized protein YndB with AHSA1/START domain
MPISTDPGAAPRLDSTADELIIVRTFEAPRELVFKVFTAPEHVMRFWGPEGFHLTHCDIDLRVGGAWRFCMSNGPGHAHWIHGVYREILPPSLLVFTYINDYDGFETVVTLRFTERDGRTEMHFHQAPFISSSERDGHGWGWNSSFDLLARYLARAHADGQSGIAWRSRPDGVAEDRRAGEERAKNGGTIDADIAKDR